MTTTPPLLTVQEPPTPLHGSRIDLLDHHPVRRSPRFVNSSRHKDRTPSPGLTSRSSPRSPASVTPHRKPQKEQPVRGTSPGYSPASSPISPPRMQRTKPRSTISKTLEPPNNPQQSMLPTPVKTPRKKEIKQTVKPAARVLFPHRSEIIDEIMPTPRKRARQGLSLESFTENDGGGHEEIPIFTDSKDKVPELDESTDNPFYTKESTSAGKKRKHAPDHDKGVQDALERDEGMVYVFRGKKIYRKFDNIDDSKPEGGEQSMRGMPIDDLESPKPFTRSSVKPRFLFGKNGASTAEKAGTTTDEEAATDIEELTVSDTAETPSKPRTGAPATPPPTLRGKRVTFFAKSDDEAEDEEADDRRFTVKKARKSTPFDNWQRTKNGSASATTKGKKRHAGEALDRDDGKRTKIGETL